MTADDRGAFALMKRTKSKQIYKKNTFMLHFMCFFLPHKL